MERDDRAAGAAFGDRRRSLAARLASTPFPVFGVATPSLGDAFIGDAHVVSGVVQSVGIAYGNPLTDGPTVQVVTAPAAVAPSMNHLLDVEVANASKTLGGLEHAGDWRVGWLGWWSNSSTTPLRLSMTVPGGRARLSTAT